MVNKFISLVLLFLLLSSFSMAQVREVTGTVRDEQGLPMIGVTVLIEGTTLGSVTDLNGKFSINVEPGNRLRLSYVGCQEQILDINEHTHFDITLVETVTSLEEVVVMGYGQLQKVSVVGAIAQVKGEDLLRTGGVSTLSNAITGLLPGVITIQTTGEPGAEQADIYIRGQNTWNGGQPLILVDGVERSMNDIDPTEVASISVLKDASATSVFGVKGANGVILITTQRGKTGKPNLEIGANTTLKTLSRIPNYLGSYDAIKLKNKAIENEININEQWWNLYMPEELLDHYRAQDIPYIFPNVYWPDYMIEDYALSHRFNMNVSGGTEFVKYFGSLAYLYEGDILGTRDYGQGYDPNFSYNRYNFRSNLDFKLTRTTDFSVDLSGFYGSKKEPAGGPSVYWKGVYWMPPDLFPVQYEDGIFAQNKQEARYSNPVAALNMYGYDKTNQTQLLTDFKLKQNLDFITKGLSFNAKLSYDNIYTTQGIQVSDQGTIFKYIIPEKIMTAETAADSAAAIVWDWPSAFGLERHQFNYVDKPYTVSAETAQNNVFRNLFYQLSFNYERQFGRHTLTGLILMNREKNARGAEFPHYREDWVGRLTYNYGQRYFLELNGAYNGSEKFGPKYRFGFFPSVAVGWLISNEKFFQGISNQFNKLKIRYSDGLVGNDAGIERWLYVGGWTTGNRHTFGYPILERSFNIYQEGIIANPDIHWEVAHKRNIGLETSFLNFMFSLDFDFFWEDRKDIFMSASQRNIPAWFGAPPVAGNIGQTKSHGWEVELRFKRQTSFKLLYWANASYAFAKDRIIYKEDPELMPDYQKQAGFQIGQIRSQITNEFMDTWDEVYTSTLGENNTYTLPGDFNIVDFNADGIINSYDEVPYAFPDRPLYSYNLSAGTEWKGLSVLIQFYGVHNVNRIINLPEFQGGMSTVRPFHLEDSWTPERAETATYPSLRYENGSPKGNYNVKNASYIRLKTAEISYNLKFDFLSKLGISRMRLFINGNNLFLWSKMLEDREGGSYDDQNYPMVRRYNFGTNINF